MRRKILIMVMIVVGMMMISMKSVEVGNIEEVSRGGMRYMIVSKGDGLVVVNLTKDKLEVEKMKMEIGRKGR